MTDTNIGAHKSAAGGYVKACKRVHDITGTCIQLFSSSPRTWAGPNLTDEEIENFKQKRQELNLDPAVFHAPYLINLADRSGTGQKSVKAMVEELNVASECGIIGSVVHVGSYKTDDEKPEDDTHYEHLIDNIQTVLEETPEDTWFIIENMGTRKIGKDIDRMGELITDLGGSDRLKVCLDTCHLHAAGYNLATADDFDSFFTSFDNKIGTDRLAVMHVNDSRDPAGSLRDRHANIGEGEIPEGVFENILTKQPTKDLPIIIETPGFGDDGPDKKNIDRLRNFVN